MKIRLYNARILDLNNVHSIRKGEIHVSDSLIENVIYDDTKGDSDHVSSAEDGTVRMSPCLFDKNVDAGSASNVIMTMCAGKILYMNGEYDLGFDTDELLERCGRSTDRILGRI